MYVMIKKETEQEALKKQISDHLKHIKLIKRDVLFKEEQIKKYEKTISNLEKTFTTIESKSKIESKTLLCKDTIIKTYKEKIKTYELNEIKQKTLTELVNTLKLNISQTKKEIIRKNDLVMHWKERAVITQKEIEQFHLTKDKKLDTAINNLQISLRITKEKLSETTKDLERYKNRDKQYINVLSQFIVIVSKYDVKNGIVDDDVNSMAKKLSRQILELDWDDINTGGDSEDYKVRLEGILSLERFEENLFNLLTEMI
jgi:chromosome segregation ATPase